MAMPEKGRIWGITGECCNNTGRSLRSCCSQRMSSRETRNCRPFSGERACLVPPATNSQTGIKTRVCFLLGENMWQENVDEEAKMVRQVMCTCVLHESTKQRHTQVYVEKVKVNALGNSLGPPSSGLYVMEGKPPPLPAHLPLFHLFLVCSFGGGGESRSFCRWGQSGSASKKKIKNIGKNITKSEFLRFQ